MDKCLLGWRQAVQTDEIEVAMEEEEDEAGTEATQTEEATPPQRACLLEDQRGFQKQPGYAYEEKVEKSPTVVFNAIGSEVEVVQAEQGDSQRSMPAIAIESCSAVLEVSDLQGDDTQVQEQGRESFRSDI